MNSDDSLPPSSSGAHPPPPDPALEARIVACVLGEASPAEIAEIDRLCAERPELAEFRRHLSATQDLVAEAHQAAPTDLRLSPERRAKLLAALRASTSAENAKLPPLVALPSRPGGRRWQDWAFPAAACVALAGLLAAIVIPTVGTTFGVASKSARPAPQELALELSAPESAKDQKKAAAALFTRSADGFADDKAEFDIAERENRAASEGPMRVDFPSPPGAPSSPPPPSLAAPSPARPAPVAGPKDARRLGEVSIDVRRDRAPLNKQNATETTKASGALVSFDMAPAGSVNGQSVNNVFPVASAESAHDLTYGAAGKNDSSGLDVRFEKKSAPLDDPVVGDLLGLSPPNQAPISAAAPSSSTFIPAAELQLAGLASRVEPEVKPEAADAEIREETRAKMVAEVARSWQRPGIFNENKARDADAAAPQSADAPRQTRDEAVRRKLQDTVVPSISFNGTPLGKALSALSSSAEEYGGDGQDTRCVSIVLDGSSVSPEPIVNITLRNMPLGRVLDILTEQTGRTYEIRDGAVVVLPPDAAKPAPRPAPDASLRREVPSADQPVSTFSLHVSDASFRIARAALARGEFPDPTAMRPEEFYNAFDYGDPAPLAGEAVAARVEQAAHPLLQQRNLLRVALRVPAAGRAAGQPLHLTLLLDTSGSMEREDRAATVRAALTQLASLLGPADRVTLIGFARTPRLLADRISGDQAATLAQLAANTPPEGGTNLDAALQLAADLAFGRLDPAAQNRVVLLTDGAANLGDADPAALAARVVQLRQKGVAFDACGVGANGLDDGVLEALTRQGDGRYLLLDTAEEAGPAFARQLAGAFRPAAQNVKVQVRFNASRVPRYRLIGFEQHRLREEDFRNDKVDAAELASAEAAVALYQIEVDPQGAGELGEVFVRFRETSTGRMVERSWPLPYDASAPAFDRASPSLQLAGAAALLAEKLQGGDTAAAIRLADLDPIAAALRARFVDQPRVVEFLDMLSQARRLSPE